MHYDDAAEPGLLSARATIAAARHIDTDTAGHTSASRILDVISTPHADNISHVITTATKPLDEPRTPRSRINIATTTQQCRRISDGTAFTSVILYSYFALEQAES